MDAIDIYRHPGTYPRVQVLQHAIARAVIALDKSEALALIRAAYAAPDDAFATLDEARLIYESILARAKSHASGLDADVTTVDEDDRREISCPDCAGALVRHDGELVPYDDSATGDRFMIVHLEEPPYVSRAGFLLYPDTPQVRALITQWRDQHGRPGEMDETDYLALNRFIEERYDNLPRYITAWVGDL